jgi:hypothetical protein
MMVVWMQTIVDWFREHEGWRCERCAGCGGHGLVSDFGCGEDFYGAKECDCCAGTGVQWRTPRGRYVLYPGGPFC